MSIYKKVVLVMKTNITREVKILKTGDFQRNNSLDFLKGVACIGVVLIHVTFPGVVGAVLSKLSTFAVPLFFMISGYYAYDKNGCAQSKIKRRTVRILKIFLCSLFLYVPYRMFRMYELGQLNLWLENTLNAGTLVNAIAFHSYGFIGAEHLWFLTALLYTYLLMFFMEKYDLHKLSYKLLPVLFALNVLGGIGIIGAWGNTFLIRAVPFFILGNYMAYKPQSVQKISNAVLQLLILINAILICICFAIDWNYNPYQFCVIIYSAAIFILAIKNPDVIVNEKVELLGRKYSLFVYVIHIFINSRLNIWINYLGLSEFVWVKWMFPIVVIMFSIGMSVLVDFLMNQIASFKR